MSAALSAETSAAAAISSAFATPTERASRIDHTIQGSDAALDSAMVRLSQVTLSQANFRASATAFCTDLALLTGAARISLGWLKKHECNPVAVSNSGSSQLEIEQAELLSGAMLEAIDQRCVLQFPPPHRTEVARRILRAQERVARANQGAILTIPLADRHQLVAAVIIEFSAIDPLSIDVRRLAEHATKMIAPILVLIREREAPLHQRLLRRSRGATQNVASRRMWRFVGASAAVLLLAAAIIPINHTVSAPARIEGEIQRIVAAPTKGYLKEVLVRPGDTVKAGQILAALGERDLELERNKLRSEMAQHESAASAGLAKGDRSAMAISQAKADESRAQLGLIDHQLEQIQLTAPIDGVLIQGDLAQSVGAPVDRGQTLFTIAPSNRYRVIVELDERDVRRAAVGLKGELSLSALPWDTMGLTIKRVAPMANVLEGRNVFELEAVLNDAVHPIRPGLRGTAHLSVGEAALLSIWGRRAIDSIKRWTWRWSP